MAKKKKGDKKEADKAKPAKSSDDGADYWAKLGSLFGEGRWQWIVGVVTVGISYISRAPLYGLIIIDDSFITYTYSKNLVEHGQFVYNLGERTLATTTPLYALILSVFMYNGADLFYAAPIFNLLLDCLIALFGFLVIRQIFSERAWIVYCVFAPLFFLQPYQMWSSTAGMETSLYVLLTVLIVWAALGDRWIWAGVIASLLCMTRPDGAIIGICVMVYHIVSKRSFPWRGLIAFLVASLPWLVFSLAYFGSPIPTGVTAKIVLGEDYATPIGRKFKEIYFSHYKRKSYFLLSATFIGVAGMGWAVYSGAVARDWKRMLYVLFFILFNCAFMLTGTAFGWYWYYVPLYLPLYMYAGYLCAEAAGRFKPAAVVVAVWMLIIVGAIFSKHLPYEYHRLKVKSLSWDQGVRQPCIWVSRNAPADASLMCKTVGIPGYYSNRRVIDPLCIVSPELLKDYPGKEKAEIETLKTTKPDYFLSWDVRPHEIPNEYNLVKEYRMAFALVTYNSTWLYKKK